MLKGRGQTTTYNREERARERFPLLPYTSTRLAAASGLKETAVTAACGPTAGHTRLERERPSQHPAKGGGEASPRQPNGPAGTSPAAPPSPVARPSPVPAGPGTPGAVVLAPPPRPRPTSPRTAAPGAPRARPGMGGRVPTPQLFPPHGCGTESGRPEAHTINPPGDHSRTVTPRTGKSLYLHVCEDPRGGAPPPRYSGGARGDVPKAIPAPSIVANPSGSPVPDEGGEPEGLRAHPPGEQRGKAKPGGLVSPREEQERHGHLRGPETGTESPPPTRAPASRTFLSSHACVPPPPTEQGRPHRGGDERPARCASAGRAKNNCGVLATAFPLAGLPGGAFGLERCLGQ
ncbi:translation initiation factor IF-2-like [Melozone crissalis]|uniref:translation initiation factor IF-2-like n=1 Tax=Melozone crissalis TaxID=40204 RepID=UPI0023DADD23|nr:translation initiation factor IF-2-like [Melozone crissalis]